MKLLITGGAGFIGSHLAENYAKKYEEVIVYDDLSRARTLKKKDKNSLYNWNYLKNAYSNVKMVKADVRNFNKIKEAGKGVDAIIHAAAQVAVTTSLAEPRTDFEINALGTFNALEVARLNDATFVLCSTNKVYGENVNKIPLTEYAKRYYFTDKKYKDGIPESFPTDQCCHSPYGCSKLAADIYTQEYAHTYGLKTSVFRLSCIYGERQFGVEDQGWVAWFVTATLTDKPITIYGDGKQARDILYIRDLVEAFDAFMTSNQKHEVFNLGGGPDNTISLLELLDLLKKHAGKRPRISFKNWRPADQKVYVSNISKAKTLLNWEPKINPKEGVKRLIKWVHNNLELFVA